MQFIERLYNIVPVCQLVTDLSNEDTQFTVFLSLSLVNSLFICSLDIMFEWH